MLRPLALLLCSLLVAVAATAAPAPVYRHDPTRWFGLSGWDKPVDRVGDCRFDREGDGLTIAVPGKGHTLFPEGGDLSAPHLLRGVEGDFAVQVCIGGDFPDTDLEGPWVARGAGILVTDGITFVRFERVVFGDTPFSLSLVGVNAVTPTIRGSVGDGPPFRGPTHLRVERRKGLVTMKYGTDGRKWTTALGPLKVVLPRKLKVGVFAEAEVPGTFEPVFDEFELTPLK